MLSFIYRSRKIPKSSILPLEWLFQARKLEKTPMYVKTLFCYLRKPKLWILTKTFSMLSDFENNCSVLYFLRYIFSTLYIFYVIYFLRYIFSTLYIFYAIYFLRYIFSTLHIFYAIYFLCYIFSTLHTYFLRYIFSVALKCKISTHSSWFWESHVINQCPIMHYTHWKEYFTGIFFIRGILFFEKQNLFE